MMASTPPSHLFFTLDESARQLGLASSTLGRYVREHRIEAQRVGGRPRISAASLAKFAESRPVYAPAPKKGSGA